MNVKYSRKMRKFDVYNNEEIRSEGINANRETHKKKRVMTLSTYLILISYNAPDKYLCRCHQTPGSKLHSHMHIIKWITKKTNINVFQTQTVI